ncbi:MAG: hypothetical protein ACRDQ4_03635 [Pseudonocardiaceae bacterium]
MTAEREWSEWKEALRAQRAEIARLEECVRAAERRARLEMERGREERKRTEAQRAQWAETARLGERAREEARRAQRERKRGRDEHARTKALRAQWADIARLEERARAAERRALWEERARAEEESARSEPARSSHFLLAIAVRLLPPSERDRYLEEFRAELLDMPRDTQLSHALSLLRGSFVLRLRRGFKKPTDVAVSRAKDLPSTRST